VCSSDLHYGELFVLLPTAELEGVYNKVKKAHEELAEISNAISLSTAQRRIFQGADSRRFGFLSKTFEVASDNPQFVPLFLDMDEFSRVMSQLEVLRNILITSRQVERLTGDNLLQTSDLAYRLSLMYYNSVRDAHRRRVPSAQAIFEMLQGFFRRRPATPAEPTAQKALKDAKALLRGSKDGKVIIEGHGRQITPADKTIIDQMQQKYGAWKEIEKGIICPNCSTRCDEHMKFCHNCGKELVVA
jgi:hypothetical protein